MGNPVYIHCTSAHTIIHVHVGACTFIVFVYSQCPFSEALVDEADYVNDLHNNDGGKEEEYENDTVTITAPLTNEDEVGEKHEAMSEKDDNEQLKAITPEVSKYTSIKF